MDWLFPPFDPDRQKTRKRFRSIPIRMLVPNVITLLAICMGLTAVRMAMENKFDWAVAAIVIASLLDMLDGRIARLLKATSRFGAELDSLADFVNFGVAPAVILYIWSLSALKSVGWIGVMAFSICCVLRLARFNVAIESEKPAWQNNFFIGMPAPAGAMTLLLPLYLEQLGNIAIRGQAIPILVYCAIIAFLMVSRVPTFSGKNLGKRVPAQLVVPLFFLVVLFAAFLVSFPWLTLTLGTIGYLISIPLSASQFMKNIRSDRADAASTREPRRPRSIAAGTTKKTPRRRKSAKRSKSEPEGPAIDTEQDPSDSSDSNEKNASPDDTRSPRLH